MDYFRILKDEPLGIATLVLYPLLQSKNGNLDGVEQTLHVESVDSGGPWTTGCLDIKLSGINIKMEDYSVPGPDTAGKDIQMVSPSSLQPGDQIATYCSQSSIPYYRHGIYVGDEKVIYFVGDENTNAVIKKSDLEEFCEGDDTNLYKVKYEDCDEPANQRKVKSELPCDNPENVVRVAEAQRRYPLMCGQTVSDYNIISKGSEHFATFCKLGKNYSKIVRKALLGVAAAIGYSIGVGALGVTGVLLIFTPLPGARVAAVGLLTLAAGLSVGVTNTVLAARE